MSQRPRPTEEERQAARDYLEHDRTRRHLSGEPAREAHRNAEDTLREHPRARIIALAGGPSDLGRLPTHLRSHQLRERHAAGISARQAADLRRRGYENPPDTRRRTPRERAEDVADTAARHGREFASTAYGAAADTGWGDLLGDIILWGIGLSISYLLLTRIGGVSKLFEGATQVTRYVVSPTVDPLNPKGAL